MYKHADCQPEATGLLRLRVSGRSLHVNAKLYVCLAAMLVLQGCVTQPGEFDLSYPEYGMNQLKEAAIDGRERYVVDDSTRYCSPKRRTAITRPAWKALKSCAPELPEATILITTTTRTDDIVESVILIDGPSTALRCEAMGGSVLYVCLYVYTCTVRIAVSP
jgi:hypothetical protein